MEDDPTSTCRISSGSRPLWKHGGACCRVHHTRRCARTVRRQLGRSARRCGISVQELLECWSIGWSIRCRVACCWHEAFSQVLVALRSNEEKAVIEANIALAMHLNGCGELGNWTADVEEQMQCLWGNWLLPKFDRVAVHSNGAEAVLTLNCGGRATGFGSYDQDRNGCGRRAIWDYWHK